MATVMHGDGDVRGTVRRRVGSIRATARPGRFARSGTWNVGFPVADGPKQVSFGPSGLTLYASDLAFLERVRAGRAATNPEGERACEL